VLYGKIATGNVWSEMPASDPCSSYGRPVRAAGSRGDLEMAARELDIEPRRGLPCHRTGKTVKSDFQPTVERRAAHRREILHFSRQSPTG
jgi:hypothetical protein